MGGLRFYISRAGEDAVWGTWIASVLGEDVCFLQEQNMQVGHSIVGVTGTELGDCDHVIAVLSPDYLAKPHCLRELYAAVMRDPDGRKRVLMPIRVRECETPADISHLVCLRLADRDERAKLLLLEQIGGERAAVKDSGYRTSRGNLPVVNPLLIGREEELAFLDRAWADPAANFVQIIAPGGTGKTALTDKWFRRHLEEATVFGWSFYSQGVAEDRQTSSDPFFEAILGFFGIARPEEASPYTLSRLVAERLRAERVLLILDGVEPLQDNDGRVRDAALGYLLHELAMRQKGLVVCSTRQRIEDVPDDGDRALSIDLENLDAAQGASYLRALKVAGTEAELREASAEYANHALALTLLGHYLVDFHKGDVRARVEIPALMADDVKQGRHARRVMESYARRFAGTAELEVLRALGYFNRPAEPKALRLVLPEMEERSYQAALNRLFGARLILSADAGKAVDCHPLVREHFAAAMRSGDEAAFRAGHGRLYEFYCAAPKKRYPDTLEEMTPLFYAVYHGCQAGRYQEARDDVCSYRILRGEVGFLLTKIGAFGTNLSLLANFFESPWTRPATELSAAKQAWVVGEAAFTLRAVGRLAEAVEPMRLGAETDVKLEHWASAARSYGNLAELLVTMGEVREAITQARVAVGYADRSGDEFQRTVMRTTLADALHQAGDLAEAEALFQEAERMQAERQPKYPILYSLRGYQYCDLLLRQGRSAEVLRRATQTLDIAKANRWLLDIGLDLLSVGRAYAPGSAEAAAHLDQAVEFLRRAGAQDMLPLALLARGNPDDLNEVFTIATRSGMRLYLADYHLAMARRDPAGNREHIEKAAKTIEETGYHRRDAELAELRRAADAGSGAR